MKKKRDHYSQRARDEGYEARSAYKLKEINKEYVLIKPGNRVLELGCSPGGWSQIAVEVVGNNGSVVGVDEKPIRVSGKGFEFIQADVFEFSSDLQFDAVISDMAPRTTGQRELDQERSYQLSIVALKIAQKNLKKGGTFLCKIFQGPGYDDFVLRVKKSFTYMRTVKPKASKSESKEMYVIGKGRR